ncbi:hypothetical protein [Corynebacterium deserti]|nr:hypothetical protein [Corynebacterium deserti]
MSRDGRPDRFEAFDDDIETLFLILIPFGVIVFTVALLAFPIGWMLS